MKARRLIAGLAMAALSGSVNAQGIKYINYHPDNIPTITTAPGIASEIIFEDDETIEYFTFGFDDAWTSTVAMDHILIFKSKDEQPETNLLVHTNKRNYVFTLITGNSEWEKYPDRSKAVYSMRIRYQDAKSKAALAKQSEASVLRNRTITDATLNMYSNYDYRSTERAADIIPVRIWDNGILTFITFRPGAKRGVVYELQADGRLAQVNQNTEKNGVLVVQGVYPSLMIRLGDEAVELRRNNQSGRRENETKTNVPGTRRTMDGAAPGEFDYRQGEAARLQRAQIFATPPKPPKQDDESFVVPAMPE